MMRAIEIKIYSMIYLIIYSSQNIILKFQLITDLSLQNNVPF